jgi:adenosine/AMP kinase
VPSGTDPGMAELAKKNATANPTEVVLAETEQGRGILGVVDRFSPKGVEDEGEIKWRKEFLRKIGYKL